MTRTPARISQGPYFLAGQCGGRCPFVAEIAGGLFGQIAIAGRGTSCRMSSSGKWIQNRETKRFAYFIINHIISYYIYIYILWNWDGVHLCIFFTSSFVHCLAVLLVETGIIGANAVMWQSTVRSTRSSKAGQCSLFVFARQAQWRRSGQIVDYQMFGTNNLQTPICNRL